MNLYLISQTINNGYDTYDSAVVCAESEDEARKIHPSNFVTHHRDGKWYGTHALCVDEAENGKEYETENGYCSWIPFDAIHKLDVELLGKADSSVEAGLIMASFNAG